MSETNATKGAAMKYVSRRDSARHGIIGWNVRIHGLKLCEFFPDARHGGKEAALNAALAWRDRALKKAAMPLSPRNVVIGARAGTTGIHGVSLRQQGKRRYYVVSYAPEQGRSRQRCFRILDEAGGERRALRDAVAFRRKQEEKIHGRAIAPNWNRVAGKVCG